MGNDEVTVEQRPPSLTSDVFERAYANMEAAVQDALNKRRCTIDPVTGKVDFYGMEAHLPLRIPVDEDFALELERWCSRVREARIRHVRRWQKRRARRAVDRYIGGNTSEG